MRRSLPWIWCALLVVAGCATDQGVRATDSQTSPGSFDPGTAEDPFGWTALDGHPGVEVGTFTVPIDYNDPSKGRFNLNVARHVASDPSQRVGTLLVNPGGPGAAGVDLAIFADLNYGPSLLQHFDILAWDPRGTGASTPAIDCTDDYDHFYAEGDITPDDAAEREQLVDLAKEFATDCTEKNGAFYQYVGTNNSARDMDAIRGALGESKISYFGFSYGSELGAVWATLFPATVRAAVLDGAVDPTVSSEEQGIEQSKGFEASLDTFLSQCSSDPSCSFHNGGHADTAFDQLMDSLDANPVPSEQGRPDVSLAVAITGVAEAMYDDSTWPELAEALTAAQKGDGSGLLKLYDEYNFIKADGTYENVIEAFQVISCMDTKDRPTVEQSDADVPAQQAAAPRINRRSVGDYFCTFFPPPTDPEVTITGDGAGPIVVVGTTGDPATPLAGAEKMAESLDEGRLVTVVGNQHTGYEVNECSTRAVEAYLVDPAGHLPAVGLRCG
jgi:pimeloyl-ACP methyl ester carboxylesterase